ncbi:MAG TPA: TasA family protein [Acidimicrobiales bacterium]|jgi:hypothetical protein|nr:TasA family protein [Acidimicrobiales bacterium]
MAVHQASNTIGGGHPGARKRRGLSRRGKILATVATLATAAAVAGLGTFGTFTSTTTAGPQADSSGTVVLTFGANNRLAVGATNLAAGDTFQRGFELDNTGTLDMASVTATVTPSAGTSSKLDTDAVNGLQLQIDKCSQAWVEAGTAPAYTYTCGGTTTSALASTPVANLTTNTALSGLSSLTAGSSDYLRATFTLPQTADNTFQGLSTTLNVAFTGTQRAATNK